MKNKLLLFSLLMVCGCDSESNSPVIVSTIRPGQIWEYRPRGYIFNETNNPFKRVCWTSDYQSIYQDRTVIAVSNGYVLFNKHWLTYPNIDDRDSDSIETFLLESKLK